MSLHFAAVNVWAFLRMTCCFCQFWNRQRVTKKRYLTSSLFGVYFVSFDYIRHLTLTFAECCLNLEQLQGRRKLRCIRIRRSASFPGPFSWDMVQLPTLVPLQF